MRRFAALFLLSLAWVPGRAADADEGDRAPPQRWNHLHGPASGSGRSHAEAPETLGAALWDYAAAEVLLAPPVVWESTVFLLDGSGEKARVVALEAETGEPLADATARPSGRPRLAAQGRCLFLVEEERLLVQFRLWGRKLERLWSFDVGKGASAPVVFAGEVYVATPAAMLRLRPGASEPVWKAEGDCPGDPCLYGGHVYALRRAPSGGWKVVALTRDEGSEAASADLPGAQASPDEPGRVIATDKLVSVRLPGKPGVWALFDRKEEQGKVELSYVREEKLEGEPVSGDSALFGLTAEPRAWSVLQTGQRPRIPLVLASDRPDLFEGTGPCVSLSGTLCFGTWAGEINGNRIIWTVRGRKDLDMFSSGVRFHAVPLDHGRLLLVTTDGKRLFAFGPKEIQ